MALPWQILGLEWFRGWDTSHPNLGNVKDDERIVRDNEIDGRTMGTRSMVERWEQDRW